MDISIRQILFATDFSAPSKHAQEYAVELAKVLGAQLHVLNVVKDPHPLPSVAGLIVGPTKEVLPQIVKNAEQILERQISDDLARYPRVQHAVKAGDPTLQIIDYAGTHNIDLIVIGTHGRTGLSHFVIGSVAERLVRISSCPVLTVHPEM